VPRRPDPADPDNSTGANLRRIQEMLTTRLEAFGRREYLTLSWQPPGQPATGPAQTQ